MKVGTTDKLLFTVRKPLAMLCAAAIGLAAQTATAQPPAPSRAATASQNQERSVIGLITGGVDGTYIRVAADMAAVLDTAAMRVVPMVGRGSVQNIDDILHLRGVDAGIVQSDVLAYIKQRRLLPNAERSVGYIAKLYDEEVHVLARPGITTMQDLTDKTVNMDGTGSGTALTASILFDRLGIMVKEAHDDQATALDKLQKGEIDALVYVAGRPVRLISGVKADSGLHLLPIPMTAALAESYLPAQLEQKDYPALIEDGTTVSTVAVGAVLAVFQWQPGTERYRNVTRFVNALFTNFDRFKLPPRHPKWRDVNLAARVPGWTRFPAAEEQVKQKSIQ